MDKTTTVETLLETAQRSGLMADLERKIEERKDEERKRLANEFAALPQQRKEVLAAPLAALARAQKEVNRACAVYAEALAKQQEANGVVFALESSFSVRENRFRYQLGELAPKCANECYVALKVLRRLLLATIVYRDRHFVDGAGRKGSHVETNEAEVKARVVTVDALLAEIETLPFAPLRFETIEKECRRVLQKAATVMREANIGHDEPALAPVLLEAQRLDEETGGSVSRASH